MNSEVDQLSKRKEAEQWLRENASYLEIKHWGGSFTSKSTILNKNTGKIINKDFSSVKASIKRGFYVGGKGVKQIFSEKEAKHWLQENASQIDILEWGGGATKVSKFYNKNVGKTFNTTFSSLKSCVLNYEGREVGSGLDNRRNNLREAQQILEKYTDRYKVIQYFSGGREKSLFYDKDRDLEFWYHWASFLSSLRLNSNFVPFNEEGHSNLEKSLKYFLEELNINYFINPLIDGTSYKPDFLLPDHNLIIECDGLFWHSDYVKLDKYYHKKKKEEYKRLGYNSLFFREDEINNKFDVVKSIIRNSLGLNKDRFFARKCSVDVLSDKEWISNRHLMGKGFGSCYALFRKGYPVAAIQVKWVNKKERILEISRFCTEMNTTVVGAFSKLVKHVERCFSPNKIITFIDNRYGLGEYLSELGFEKKTNHISFRWVQRVVSIPRMRFPGNSGYDYGLYKIWDCGQSKYELVCA